MRGEAVAAKSIFRRKRDFPLGGRWRTTPGGRRIPDGRRNPPGGRWSGDRRTATREEPRDRPAINRRDTLQACQFVLFLLQLALEQVLKFCFFLLQLTLELLLVLLCSSITPALVPMLTHTNSAAEWC